MVKVGIVGYGNLGKGVDLAVKRAPDMECVGVFTRRNPSSVTTLTNAKVYSFDDMKKFKGEIDVMMLCGGSATDLPSLSAGVLKDFNTVDSFDTHAKIPEYFENLDKVGKESGTLAAISIGWDPGLFSMARALFGAVLPSGEDYTFWGKGVSQGHSDAIRRIKGVKKAIQYTVPIKEAMDKVRSGDCPKLSTKEKHLRECFVVAEDGADKEEIERQIVSMPNYFSDYIVTVNFITEEEFDKNHKELPHGGFVMRSGSTTDNHRHHLELSIKLDSNPEFTGSVLTAFARAAHKMREEGKVGAISVLDIPLKYLSPFDEEYLRSHLL